jgi:5'-nucleotidase
VSRAENPENEGTGRFPQVAGLRYSWNPDQPAGSRIVSVEVRNADGSYTPVDPAATYKVVSNDFMRNGGDGYEAFVNARNVYDSGPSLDQAVQEYIAAFSPVSPQLEGRISRVGGTVPTTSAPAAPTTAPAGETPQVLPTSGGVVSYLPELITGLAGLGLLGTGLWLRRKK